MAESTAGALSGGYPIRPNKTLRPSRFIFSTGLEPVLEEGALDETGRTF
ncbi:MAG: hypothetical protein P1P89_23270 [Desulfobacterales bacterium]|nr:hypothetical protein [Desulfobacterales bacterium]